jgi:hypothetical protein
MPSGLTARRQRAQWFELPAKADHQLLSSLAEGRPVWARQAAAIPNHVRPAPAQPDGHPMTRKRETKIHGGSSPTTVDRASQGHAAIVNLLLKRVSGALAFSGSPAEQGRDLPLSDQWSASLEGAEAPSELLNRAVSLSQEVSIVEVGNRGEVHSDSVPATRSQRPGEAGRNADTEIAGELVAGQLFCQAPPSASPSEDVLSSRSSVRAPLLPLISSESGGRPPSLLRRETAEAAAFDWNLAALSAGIKRLLDEEARRHGIDV